MSEEAERPKVLVTGPAKTMTYAWWATRFMLSLFGFRAVYLTASSPTIPQGIKGVIIGGGDDIEPEHYGHRGDAGVTYDPDRDRLEMAVAETALKQQLPLFGICRGAQLINVVMGGTLYPDIRPLRKLTPNRNSVFPIKSVALDQSSFLRQHIASQHIQVNSLHSQAIDQVASILRVVARDQDGFIQAVEGNHGSYVMGTQWHPEYLPYLRAHRAVFKTFTDAVEESDIILDHDEVLKNI